MSQYPRDEFDKIPESASRQGVHRERLVPPRSSGLALKILVGVLALAVGLAAYFILPRLGIGADTDRASDQSTSAPAPGTSSASPSSTADDDAAEPRPTPSATATENPTDEPTDAQPTDAEPTDAEPTPTEEPVAIDRTQPVNVYNATGISGLASSAAGRVSANGWAVGQIADWAGAPMQGSVIFYNNASQLPAAQEVAGMLGIPTLMETPEVSTGITVVVGPGFQ